MPTLARSTAITVLGLVALLHTPAFTQQPQPPSPRPPQLPRFRGGANLVNVDVYVTKDGVPVQDLRAEDFEVFEDNAPQKVDTFEHIVVTPAGPGETRVEPNSVSAANQLVADPRRRVFVVFLDTEHVAYEGSHAIREPLIDLLNRVMGADDLVALMTPEMSPSQLTFGRRTDVIAQGLRDHWFWGRHSSIVMDDREKLYAECYPPANSADTNPSRLAVEMIERRREMIVMDSFRDLIRHMENMREGRTAVITVSDGWKLLRPDPSMMTVRKDDRGNNADPIPGPPPVGVGPGGTLTSRLPSSGYGPSDRTECDKERMDLSMMDNEHRFRDLLGEANRANVSFYTVDPRGLATADLGLSNSLVPQDTTWNVLRARRESLQTLAENTDAIALVGSNDLRKELRRIADDLTSYYLMGYYSTNAKLDGRFRNIKVRAKRPGVEVRARKGYRAATQEDVDRARASTSTVVPEHTAALNRALGSIESDVRAQGRVVPRGPGEPAIYHRGPSTGNQVQPAAGRVFPRSERIRMEMEAAAGTPLWTGVLLDRNGKATVIPVTTSERTDAASGQRWFVADITLAPLGPGDYVVELTTAAGAEQKKTLVAIRVTQ